ncbi:hypothetical protein ACIPPS_16675 [Streptomyces sp. NPDC090127]|uniref:hypothetical protein n=1 Tax=Streptomyces sp. NPDC090127 TaxID=3365953 RepID=UPI003820832F
MTRPVECATCGNRVLCEKFSPAHTSVRWSAPSAAVCPVIRARVAAGEPAGRVRRCEELRGSIEAAVASGALEVTGADLP